MTPRQCFPSSYDPPPPGKLKLLLVRAFLTQGAPLEVLDHNQRREMQPSHDSSLRVPTCSHTQLSEGFSDSWILVYYTGVFSFYTVAQKTLQNAFARAINKLRKDEFKVRFLATGRFEHIATRQIFETKVRANTIK